MRARAGVTPWTGTGRASAAAKVRRAPLGAEEAYRDALNNLAWLLYEQGEDLPEAEALARRAIAAGGPDPHLALDTLARIQAARGRCDESAETFRKTLDQAPADAALRGEIESAANQAESTCAARASP